MAITPDEAKQPAIELDQELQAVEKYIDAEIREGSRSIDLDAPALTAYFTETGMPKSVVQWIVDRYTVMGWTVTVNYQSRVMEFRQRLVQSHE